MSLPAVIAMQAQKLGLAMIDVVSSMPQIEVQDVDRHHLDDLFIVFPGQLFATRRP